jgi:glycosyltransferase involved in cell wall biosynthesis
VPDLGAAFGLDVSRVRERIVRKVPRSFAVPGEQGVTSYAIAGLMFDRALTSPYDVFVYSGHGVPPVCYARSGIIYQHFPIEGHPLHAIEDIDRWRRRHRLARWARSVVYRWLWQKRLGNYQAVFVNSRFTAAWLERMWQLTPTVLYPPVSLEVTPKPKRNTVVSLGRFDARDRKNLRSTIEAFSRFLAGAGGDWSLCMMGFCGKAPEDVAQLESLRWLAAGLPVTILPNADRSVMADRLSEARLFWHLRGLNTAEGTEVPPRFQEHFGIATVEAMMAGCAPLVSENGGQPEIVEPGISGMVCRDLDGMVAESIALARDGLRLDRMADQARKRSQAFHASVFDRAVAETVRDLVGG